MLLACDEAESPEICDCSDGLRVPNLSLYSTSTLPASRCLCCCSEDMAAAVCASSFVGLTCESGCAGSSMQGGRE